MRNAFLYYSFLLWVDKKGKCGHFYPLINYDWWLRRRREEGNRPLLQPVITSANRLTGKMTTERVVIILKKNKFECRIKKEIFPSKVSTLHQQVCVDP